MNTLTRTCGMLLMVAGLATAAFAQSSTTFTYQGKLSESGQAVSGKVDLRFRLFNALTGGSTIGAEVLRTNVTSSLGVFSVALDFGVEAFATGEQRFLEIAVKPAGSGSLQTLTPRTALTSIPFSMSTRGIVVDSIGRVGINTSQPTEMLDVRGATDAGILLQAGNGHNFALPTTNSSPGGKVLIYGGTGGSGFIGGGSDGGPIEILAGSGSWSPGGIPGSAGGTLLLMGGTGGSSAPGGALIIEGGPGGNAQVVGSGGNGATLFLRGGAGGTNTSTGSNGANGSVVIDRGNFGIGTAAPENQVHVSTGAIGSGWQVRMTNTSVPTFQSGMRVSDSGFLEMTNQIGGANFARLSNTGVWTAVSDLRLKSDIRDAEGLLQKALALKPITYRMKGVSGMQIGFGAQQVDEVVPELVEHGSVLTMDYSRMSVIAIGAIQEQEKELTRARGEIEAMRAKNAELETRLQKLEQMLRAQ